MVPLNISSIHISNSRFELGFSDDWQRGKEKFEPWADYVLENWK
jgi:hypothetical protein